MRIGQHLRALIGGSPGPNGRPRRALVATNHIADFGGSEMIAYEWTRCLRERGYEVDVFAVWTNEPFRGVFSSEFGLRIETDPARIRPFHYDVVYCQHHVAPLFRYDAHPEDLSHGIIAFGRLSRRTFMEIGGWAHDHALGECTFANSELTAERLIETGLKHPVRVHYNAAPAAFFSSPRALPAKPARVLVVSNHRADELFAAIEGLRATCDVKHIGRTGERTALITPDLVREADVVVSIGKTIPYALAARTPVYVYDHFGGPGYLNAENFSLAARYNFTGRCCERKLGGAEIAAEIIDGYQDAAAFTTTMGEEMLGRYRLEPYIDGLLRTAPGSNAAKRRRLLRLHGAIEREKMMAWFVRDQYLARPGEGAAALRYPSPGSS